MVEVVNIDGDRVVVSKDDGGYVAEQMSRAEELARRLEERSYVVGAEVVEIYDYDIKVGLNADKLSVVQEFPDTTSEALQIVNLEKDASFGHDADMFVRLKIEE